MSAAQGLHLPPARFGQPTGLKHKLGPAESAGAARGAVGVAAGFVVPAGEDGRMAIGKLKMVVLDAADIARLSAFYSELAGWTQRRRLKFGAVTASAGCGHGRADGLAQRGSGPADQLAHVGALDE